MALSLSRPAYCEEPGVLGISMGQVIAEIEDCTALSGLVKSGFLFKGDQSLVLTPSNQRAAWERVRSGDSRRRYGGAIVVYKEEGPRRVSLGLHRGMPAYEVDHIQLNGHIALIYPDASQRIAFLRSLIKSVHDSDGTIDCSDNISRDLDQTLKAIVVGEDIEIVCTASDSVKDPYFGQTHYARIVMESGVCIVEYQRHDQEAFKRAIQYRNSFFLDAVKERPEQNNGKEHVGSNQSEQLQ